MRARTLLALGRRLPPLDWRRLCDDRPPEGPPSGADVVIPVYGAPEEFSRCLASVLAHTDLTRHHLLAILDGPGQDASKGVLDDAQLIHGAAITVLQNERRLGFVRTANRGLTKSTRDVVLLNSDTEVTERWLDKVERAAYAHPGIATVTPFSNNATLCSLPRAFESNAIPTGYDVASFAALVERVATGKSPRLPTGVGVCLYVKRTVLHRIGLFDEEAFGLGYGEEVDFSFRALKAGYVHVLDHRTFIFHLGQRSFGSVRDERVRRAERTLRRRHPEYTATLATFMAEDPVAPAREAVVRALLPARSTPRETRPRRVLHVTHGWPPFDRGGTEVYARSLVVRQAAHRDVTVYARIRDPKRQLGEVTELIDEGARIRLVVNNFEARNPFVRNALFSSTLARDFGHLLDEVRPELVHIHHLAGLSLSLVRALRARSIPYVLQLQDWWLLCARANLLDASGAVCPGPTASRCGRCLPLTHLGPAGIPQTVLYAIRRLLAQRVARRAAAVVAGSRFVIDSLRALGLDLPGCVLVRPYGSARYNGPLTQRTSGLPLRFVYLGALMPHKGPHVAALAFEGVDPARATLDIWGSASGAPEYAADLRRKASASVRLCGALPEEDKPQILRDADVLVVPSLGHESFGIVVREAMAAGTPVLASRGSALIEAFEDGTCGAYFEPGNVEELRRWIERLCGDPAIVPRWRQALPTPKSMDDHALEIEAVYENVLSTRPQP